MTYTVIQATQSGDSVLQAGNAAAELAALLGGAGVSRLRQTGWIRATGEDRVRWLNGMVTNSVQGLLPGEGAYTFLLNAQGKIQGDGVVWAGQDALWIETGAAQVSGMMTLLDRFIIMDDVELADVTGEWAGLMIAGPAAGSLLGKMGISVDGLEPLAMRSVAWEGAELRVIGAHGPLVPRFEIWGDDAVVAKAFEALEGAGAAACGAESLEWLRVLEGTPLYGVDIRERELPQETGQTRALHFAKGCYLGQEIVERIRSRGNVHRAFSGFRLEGELAVAGAALEADGKPVGELTSVAAVSLPDGRVEKLALGYVRRETVERGLTLVYAGGVARPASLPFLSAEASGLGDASEPLERA